MQTLQHPLAHYSPADVVDWLRTTAATLTRHDSSWPHAGRPTIGTSAAEEWQHQEVLLRIRIATHEEQQVGPVLGATLLLPAITQYHFLM